jgi:putative flippase GtrA
MLDDRFVEVGRIARFGIVGVVATLVYISTSWTAVYSFGLPPVTGSIFGQALGVGVSYFGHSLFSFRVKIDHRVFLWRFILIAALTFALNIAVTWTLTGFFSLSFWISTLAVTVLIPTTNYLFNRFWVFHPARSIDPGACARAEPSSAWFRSIGVDDGQN